MIKAIAMTIALVILPLNFAFAAPANADFRTQLEEARAQKHLEMQTILQEAQLMKDALQKNSYAPLPVASVEIKSDKLTADKEPTI